MDTRLNFMQQQMVLNRRELVDFAIAELGISQERRDYEDIVSIGLTALVTATAEFDEEQEWSFDEYAFECILKEIEQYCIDENAYENSASINTTILVDEETVIGEELLASNNPSMDDEAIKTDFEKNVISIILNCLSKNERIVALYKFGMTTEPLVKRRLGIKNLGHVYDNAVMKIRRIAANNESYLTKFWVKVFDGSYFITFKCTNIQEAREAFKRAKDLVKRDGRKYTMELFIKEDRVTIKLTESFMSLSILADILNGISEFKATFLKCDKSKKPKRTRKRKQISQITGEEKRQSKEVIQRIIMAKAFTVRQLKTELPDIDGTIIANVVKQARKRNWIKRVDKGTYVMDNYF